MKNVLVLIASPAHPALNDGAIQCATDVLRAQGATVGAPDWLVSALRTRLHKLFALDAPPRPSRQAGGLAVGDEPDIEALKALAADLNAAMRCLEEHSADGWERMSELEAALPRLGAIISDQADKIVALRRALEQIAGFPASPVAIVNTARQALLANQPQQEG